MWSLRPAPAVVGRVFAGSSIVVLAFLVPLSCKDRASEGAPSAPREGASGGPSAASAPAAAPRTVRLDVMPARIGARQKTTRKTELKLEVEFWQDGQKLGSNESQRSEEYTRETEVLGLLGGAPAKVRVRYDHYHLVDAHPDKPKIDTTMLEGRTYIVDATDPPAKVTTDKGKPASDEETEALRKLHVELGADDAIVAALGTDPMPLEKTVPLRQRFFKALVSAGDAEQKGGTVALSAVRPESGRDAAVFDWSSDMKTEEEESGMEVLWHLKGQAVVGLSPAVTLRTKIDGALDVDGHTKRNGARIDLAGNGTFTDERVETPL